MGYELHIVRKRDWEDFEEESAIPLKEWIEYIKTDNELELTNFMEIKLPDGTEIRHDNIGFAIWKGYKGKTYETVWFDYQNGSVFTKNPDDEIIEKLIKISNDLNGKVQGDDGEYYGEEYLRKVNNKKKWWEFWK